MEHNHPQDQREICSNITKGSNQLYTVNGDSARHLKFLPGNEEHSQDHKDRCGHLSWGDRVLFPEQEKGEQRRKERRAACERCDDGDPLEIKSGKHREIGEEV